MSNVDSMLLLYAVLMVMTLFLVIQFKKTRSVQYVRREMQKKLVAPP